MAVLRSPPTKFALLLVVALLACFILFHPANGTSDKQLPTKSSSPRYSAMFSFGDSLADTGNFLSDGPAAFPSVGHLPYGVTYFRRPTGRCSDGRLVVDFLAEAVGLPLLEPYLSRSVTDRAGFRQGTNFAVAGSTALDAAFYEKEGIDGLMWSKKSLSVQLEWFRELKQSLCTQDDCRSFFGKSLFTVGPSGSNDYIYSLLAGKTAQEAKAYVPAVVGSISSTVQSLIEDGATDLIVSGMFPIGCCSLLLTLFPSTVTSDYDPANGCLKPINDLSAYHNRLLKHSIAQLRSKNPHARIVYADYYAIGMRMVHAPDHYGFKDGTILKACCGGGGPYNVNISAVCGLQGSTVCDSPSQYANWDGVHLTEAGYRVVATGLLHGPFADPPILARVGKD